MILSFLFDLRYLCRSQQIHPVSSSIGRILSGYKNIAPHMSVMGLLGAAAVKEWRSVERFEFSFLHTKMPKRKRWEKDHGKEIEKEVAATTTAQKTSPYIQNP